MPTTDRLVRTTSAGDLTMPEALPADGDDPAARAIVTGRAQFVSDLAETERNVDAWGAGVRSIAAIPLVTGETTHGVVAVCGTAPQAFAAHERTVLESIGRAIANAVTVLESRRVLTADSATELEFSLGDARAFFVALSARTGCRLSYEGSAHDRNDLLLFFTAEGGDPEEVVVSAGDHPNVEEARALTAGSGTNLLELRLSDASLLTRLADQGARLLSITADGVEGRLRIAASQGVNPRSVVESIAEAYPDVELIATRRRERPPLTRTEYHLSLERQLTDRQMVALQKAYVSGYFDATRRTTGDDLAASMGISRSTFHQHLRAASGSCSRSSSIGMHLTSQVFRSCDSSSHGRIETYHGRQTERIKAEIRTDRHRGLAIGLASGFASADNHQSQNGSQNGTETDGGGGSSGDGETANVRVAHLSPDAPAVDVYVDGAAVLEDVPFGAVSDYLELPAGSHTIEVAPAGQGAESAVLSRPSTCRRTSPWRRSANSRTIPTTRCR